MHLLLGLAFLTVSISAWPTKAPSPPRFPIPEYPYENNAAGLLEDFNTYMTYSYTSSNCESIWKRQEYPQGNAFEKEFPTTLVRGFFDSKTTLTAFVVYNDQLKSIVVSFRPSVTVTLWKYDFILWRTKFSSSEFPPYAHNQTWTGVGGEDRTSEPVFLQSNPYSSLTEMSSHGPIEIPSGLSVHHGFKVLYLIFREEILALTKELALKFPSYKVVFTGHSLGASIAEIAAVDFAVNGNAPDRLWLFPLASPRTGNRAWATFVGNLEFGKKGRIQRLSKFRDPVPALPFRFMNYEHIGQEHILWANNSMSECPPNPDGSMECLTGHPNVLTCDGSLHAPRFYMQYLGLQFNCSAPPIEVSPMKKKVVEDVNSRATALIGGSSVQVPLSSKRYQKMKQLAVELQRAFGFEFKN